ncbi:DUF2480 family protein [Taibaiella koreensis]|uniref:DUF2480 family protein n=1 Tax=Taibaiella koreensis TaxID=1268548 RepID=UPI000E59CCC3|nr:DUF2480 family protein [Taibaiella koreensis]
MDEMIVNKVAESGIITLNLEDFLPDPAQLAVFDLKPFLFREMILREKDFRAALPLHDWEQYQGKDVTITCSADAIIPQWAYMLIATALSPVAASLSSGTIEQLTENKILEAIAAIDPAEYADKRVVIKGCGDKIMPEAAFIAVTARLRPVVKSLMYGEPCSTVPVYKKK